MNARYTAILTATLLAACGQAPDRTAAAPESQTTSALAVAGSESTAALPAASAVIPTGVIGQNPAGRSLSIEAVLDFETPDVRKAVTGIESQTLELGGYIAGSNISSHITAEQTHARPDGKQLHIRHITYTAVLTLRVPKQKAGTLINAVQPYITVLQRQNFTAQDIALELRREALAAQRGQQLGQDLERAAQAAGKSGKADTAAAIQQKAQARTSQEEAELNRLILQDRIDFATITLNLSQPAVVNSIILPDPDAEARRHAPPLGAQITESLGAGWYGLQYAFVLLFGLWPLLLPSAAALWFYRRRKRKNGRLSEPAAPATGRSGKPDSGQSDGKS